MAERVKCAPTQCLKLQISRQYTKHGKSTGNGVLTQNVAILRGINSHISAINSFMNVVSPLRLQDFYIQWNSNMLNSMPISCKHRFALGLEVHREAFTKTESYDCTNTSTEGGIILGNNTALCTRRPFLGLAFLPLCSQSQC